MVMVMMMVMMMMVVISQEWQALRRKEEEEEEHTTRGLFGEPVQASLFQQRHLHWIVTGAVLKEAYRSGRGEEATLPPPQVNKPAVGAEPTPSPGVWYIRF